MELSANLASEYSLYNSICFAGKKKEEISNGYPSETEFLSFYQNVGQRKILLENLAPEMKGSLLYHFLSLDTEAPASPFWKHTILHYRLAVQNMHTETDNWILSMELNKRILQQIRQLQKNSKACFYSKDKTEVLCLGSKAVVGIPELLMEGFNFSICCIESDESLINELNSIYVNDSGIRKILKGEFQHYCPDRKYDVIIYPGGKTWQETEKMQALLLKLRNYLKAEKGRVLAF